MRYNRRQFERLCAQAALAIALGRAGGVTIATAQSTNGPTPEELLAASDQLFMNGWFVQADAGYAQVLTADPTNLRALAQHGYIAMLANRLDDARNLLTAALQIQPGDTATRQRLADTLYRQDDFAAAAPLYRQIGGEGQAAQLESFAGQTPYEIAGPDSTRLSLLATDPLPIVELNVNGVGPVPVIVDTGAPTLTLDQDLATSAGVAVFGAAQGMFAGGQQAPVQQARVDTLALGDVTVANLPANVAVDTNRLSLATPDGRTTQGVLGLALLSHFLTTLDYVNGALILRRRTPEQRRQVAMQAGAAGAVELPYWIAGDHFMVAHGTVNGYGPLLFLIDSGGTIGFTAPDSTIAAAGIQPDWSQARTGLGGGGPVSSLPFTADELTLGAAAAFDVPGATGAFPPAAEYQFGFHIGGAVSHQFLRQFAVTFDIDAMRLLLA